MKIGGIFLFIAIVAGVILWSQFKSDYSPNPPNPKGRDSVTKTLSSCGEGIVNESGQVLYEIKLTKINNQILDELKKYVEIVWSSENSFNVEGYTDRRTEVLELPFVESLDETKKLCF